MIQPHSQPQSFTKAERVVTLAALMLVFLLSALDQTIVATAMPRIVADLHGLELYAWVTTAYMLASTVMVPIYGRLNDVYGRKPVLVTGVLIFMVGSMLCGLAGEFGPLPILGGGMTQLIVFRALQGLGGAALFTSAFAIIGDLYPPRERAKFAGIFGSVFGVASILGPIIGGFLTDLGVTHLGALEVAGWRWIFYVNLPLTAAALFMVLIKMPRLTHKTGGRIDFLGAALIMVTFVPLLLALSLGGRDYAWSSPQVLGLLALAGGGLAAFVWSQAVSAHPIVSLSLFGNRVFSTANAASFSTAMATMGAATFLPLYMQMGQGAAATVSGLAMLPMMLGMMTASIISGQLISRTGKYKPFMLAGGVITVAALILLSQVHAATSRLDLGLRMALLGLGMGPSMGAYNIAIQNAVPRHHMGVATSASQFFRQIGGTVGVAVFGAVLTSNLAGGAAAGRGLSVAGLQRMLAGGGAIPPAVRELVVHAIQLVFQSGVLIAVAALAAVALIPALPLSAGHRRAETEEGDPAPVLAGE